MTSTLNPGCRNEYVAGSQAGDVLREFDMSRTSWVDRNSIHEPSICWLNSFSMGKYQKKITQTVTKAASRLGYTMHHDSVAQWIRALASESKGQGFDSTGVTMCKTGHHFDWRLFICHCKTLQARIAKRFEENEGLTSKEVAERVSAGKVNTNTDVKPNLLLRLLQSTALLLT